MEANREGQVEAGGHGLAGDPDKVTSWVEQNIGPVISVDLQPRWRPMWFIEAEREVAL